MELKNKLVKFKNNRGNELVGALNKPKEKSRKCIIMCHGITGTKEEPVFISLEDKLNNENFGTFRFDFEGNGNSEGKFERKTVTSMTNDLLNAIEVIKEDFGFNAIGIAARSFGSLAALNVYSENTDMFGLSLMATPFHPTSETLPLNQRPIIDGQIDLTGLYEKNLNVKFREELERLNLKKMVDSLSKILLIHGKEDKFVDKSQSQDLYELLKEPKKIEFLENTGHKFKGKQEEIASKISKWFLFLTS